MFCLSRWGSSPEQPSVLFSSPQKSGSTKGSSNKGLTPLIGRSPRRLLPVSLQNRTPERVRGHGLASPAKGRTHWTTVNRVEFLARIFPARPLESLSTPGGSQPFAALHNESNHFPSTKSSAFKLKWTFKYGFSGPFDGRATGNYPVCPRQRRRRSQ